MPIEILMPALSPTMEEGTLSSWLKKEGDAVASGDVIAEIETDKATMEVEAVDEGVVGKILVAEGSEGVKVNAVIALLLEDGEDASVLEGYEPGAAAPTRGAPETPEPAEPVSGASAPVTQQVPDHSSAASGSSASGVGGDRTKASPLAKRLAAEAGLDLAAIAGSGPHGRIVKRDVEAAKAAPALAAPPAAAPAAEAPAPVIDADEPLARFGISGDRYEVKKADGITKIAAKRLSDSFRDVPHFPLNVDCRIDALLQIPQGDQRQSARGREGVGQ
jgi:pyruvate dehydrogenase E2 component (dihydrolipoamide acetyltransferase)